jgi:hypothetical protein
MALGTGLIGLAVIVAACGGSITDPVDEAVMLEVSPAEVSLRVGESVRLVAVARSAANQAVDGETTWSSTDPGVVTVATDGTVFAVATGTASVKAEFRGKGKALGRLKKDAPVTVTDPPADQPPADDPPADDPPADEPPADEPPADEPPADEPPADEPPASTGTLIGASRFDVASGYPFTMSAQHRVHPGEEREDLEPLRANGIPGVINLVGGKSNYSNPDGSFNVEMWKAIVDQFDPAIVQEYVDAGFVLAHYVLDEPHAGGQWSGVDVDPALVDEAACHSKAIWPDLPVMIRTHPGWAVREEGAAHTFQCVDYWVAQYSARKGPIDEYIAENLADAQILGAEVLGGLNAITGGDGSSGIPSDYDPDDWVMSSSELREYGAAWISAATPYLGIWKWNDEEWYWALPEIRAAVEYLVGL